MAICLEFWDNYFHSLCVSPFDMDIRDQYNEKCIPLTVTESASYNDFKEWVHSYAPDPNSKRLYFTKFHEFHIIRHGTCDIWKHVKQSLPFSPKIMGVYRIKVELNESDSDKEHKMLCRIYLLVERMLKAGVAKIRFPETLIYKQVKREFIKMNLQAICISYAIWAGYKPPLTPECLLLQIVPRLTITEEMILDAIDMFQ